MSPLQALILGLVQGATEFLPISSTAHLILTSRLFGWQDQGLGFDMAANSGSLLAVVVYMRHEVRRLGGAWLGSLVGRPGDREAARLAWRILLATVPVAVAGLLLQDALASAGRGAVLVGVTSILFALLLAAADRRGGSAGIERIGLRAAVLIGMAQALALVPGTSRSGVVITAALFLGLRRPAAARFSFLLAIPVGVLVGVKQLLDATGSAVSADRWLVLAIGFVVSAVSAYVAIGWLVSWLRRQSLQAFVVYRVVLGIVILALAAFA